MDKWAIISRKTHIRLAQHFQGVMVVGDLVLDEIDLAKGPRIDEILHVELLLQRTLVDLKMRQEDRLRLSDRPHTSRHVPCGGAIRLLSPLLAVE